MSSLASLRPTNEAEERAKFLSAIADGKIYEPQLAYASSLKAAATRASCDQYFSSEFEAAALHVLNGVMRDFGDQTQYEVAMWGEPLESSEVENACADYATCGCSKDISGKVTFRWAPETLVTSCIGSKINLVTKTHYYRKLRLASLLDHEVGTHWVRLHNHKIAFPVKGSWTHDKGWLLATEEGLATLNTNKSYADKRLWVPALHYHACVLASRLPFSGLWKALSPYLGNDPDRLWITCLRVKRGLEDTGRPGGYYKDRTSTPLISHPLASRASPCHALPRLASSRRGRRIDSLSSEESNFCGALRLLQRRHEIDFRLLHCVRVSLEDFPRALASAKRAMDAGSAVLPAFVATDAALAEYLKQLDEIATANGVGNVQDAGRQGASGRVTSQTLAEGGHAAGRAGLEKDVAPLHELNQNLKAVQLVDVGE